MNGLSRIAVALLCAGAAIPQQAVAKSVSPSTAWNGTWRLNVGLSKFSAPAPRWETRTVSISHNRMVTRSRGVTAGGKAIHFSYGVSLDGKFHPLVGNPDGDSISMHLITPETVAIEVQRNHRTAATATTTVGARRLVMKRHRLPLSGSPSVDMLVYDRVR